MGFIVEKAGPLTTIQDMGRYGYQRYGLSPAGAMDGRSLSIANILVGNDENEGCLEVTFIGLMIRFTADNVIAVTGADLGAVLNGMEAPRYRAFCVRAGDTLSFTAAKNGMRAYVGFSGGLAVQEVMGSVSTSTRYGIGGYEGRKLKEKDFVGFREPRAVLPDMDRRWTPQEIFPSKEAVCRVVTGPHEDAFTRKGRRDFFWYRKKITNESDRMGMRLDCEPIEHEGDGNIISDGITFGAIQIPPNGKPIIMLADRQTVGGYPKIGSVISVDLPVVAQCMPGMDIRFVEVSLSLAQLLYRRQQEQMEALRRKIND